MVCLESSDHKDFLILCQLLKMCVSGMTSNICIFYFGNACMCIHTCLVCVCFYLLGRVWDFDAPS